MTESPIAEVVRTTKDGNVYTLTIAHPPANAISGAVISGIRDGIHGIRRI